jgi:ketosteroid isomerase-like protein
MSSNVARHQKAHEIFDRRDWAAMKEIVSTEASYEDHGRGITLKGADQFLGWLKEWPATFSDATPADPTYLDAGTTTVALFNARGTNDGSMGPLQATGRRIDVPFCEVLRWGADGRITGGEIFYDQMSILVQLGVIEPPATG